MRLNTVLSILGIAVIMSVYITHMTTFYVAYSNPEKEVLVTIDDYGEADLELVLLTVSMPCVLLSMRKYVKSLWRDDQ